MANSGSLGIVKFVDTFATDTNHTSAANGVGWLYLSDSDTDWVRAVAAGKGLHMYTTIATTSHLSELCSDTLLFAAQEGYCMVECMLMLSSVADISFNFGFNDDVLDSSNLLPATLSTATWTSNAATFCGLVYDTNATNDEVHCFWVDGNSDTSTALADLRMNGAAPVVNKWMYLRCELQDRGSGYGARATFHFEQNGKTFEKTFDTSITRSTPLCWYLGIYSLATATKTAYLRLPGWEQSIAD